MKKKTMMHSILSALIVVIISSCSSQKGANPPDEASTSAQDDQMTDVTLNVTMTSDYCGGAAPSEDIIAKLKKPKSFINQDFYIATQAKLLDNMKKLKTDAYGNVKTSLHTGTYYVFLPHKISAKHSGSDRTEATCTKWKNTPEGNFTVSSDQKISFNIHKTCDGCSPMRM